ncbi:MAG: carbohydrate kinase, partial [Gammaproteobacteria bacterium]|nr:carbohydrate kinase [Gammaproteobacteria bacterium]NIR85890.1 carbohydrate kinase [Gammaproteobacteria bacterium]NIR92081.1 carbohydrate kinase [Gammaproteobacteria bacterium]NIV51417.1 carbohydrate kinase [Gammaproteobacteria bacterium]NIV77102.1 carbohydrate kinase [Gammaproteobacteria bacterium]
PTGTVRVTLQGGQPSYEIVPHQAYDRIELTDTLRGAVGDEGGLLYHGSLIARSDVSRETLEALRARNPVAVFVDVNLRAPWWSREGIERLIHGARWLKLNEHELGELVGAASVTRQRMPELARSLMRRHGVAFAIVTCGAEGAVLVTEQATHDATPVPVEEIVDTVGAGDGFSAVALFGLTAGWPPEVILQRALAFAAEICRMRGATTTDHSLYDRFLDTWNA